LQYKAYEDYDPEGASVYCGMLHNDEMPAEPTTGSRSFLLYNPGTETCETLIRIGGSAGTNGITIKNSTNDTECK